MNLEDLVVAPKLLEVVLKDIELTKLGEDGKPIPILKNRVKTGPDGKSVKVKVRNAVPDAENGIRYEEKEMPVMLIAGDDFETYYTDVVFYTPDRQPLMTYLTLSQNMATDQVASIELLKTLILNKEGKPVITGEKLPPVAVMVAAMAKVMATLGK